MKTVAVLCARPDSIYKTLPGCDVYDAARDARTFSGSGPVVCHPPCRLWGKLATFANVENPHAEKALAHLCVNWVRSNGGVLEHPLSSGLWESAGLPRPGIRDSFGGFTVAMPQKWFGHRAEKWSWFYVCGMSPADLPAIPFELGEASHVIANSPNRQGLANARPEVTKRERDATPPQLANWLIDAARRAAMVSL